MPRNEELNRKLREERRRQILANALLLFIRKGLSATKITDIAAASNISQGLLYHYYRSKEAVFTELIRYAFARMNEACRWLLSQPWPPRAKIEFAVAELLRGLDQNEDSSRYHLLIAQATASEAIPAEAKAIIDQENMFPYETIAAIMKEGQQDGSIRRHDAGELALVFWTSINGLAIYKAVHGQKFKAPDPRLITSMFFTPADGQN